MGREYPSRPYAGVGGIVLKNKEVLLVRRENPPNKGVWSIPGGGVELGETLEAACRREVLEETGLSVETLFQCKVLDRFTRDRWNRVRYHYILIDFVCRPAGGELRPSRDVPEAVWFPLKIIARLKPMTAGTAEVILEAAERWKNSGTSP
jgi:ADP-ribose pyrophosphatase YjhB (NUDIX family)